MSHSRTKVSGGTLTTLPCPGLIPSAGFLSLQTNALGKAFLYSFRGHSEATGYYRGKGLAAGQDSRLDHS
jgi:hypothetical protein